MGVQRFEARAFDDDHVQGAALHGRLTQAQRREQVGGAGTGAEDDALGAISRSSTFKPTSSPFSTRFDVLTGQQAVASQIGQALDQAWHIDHQFRQAIDLALEALVLQGWWKLLALT